MTDRLKGCTGVFDRDVREDDAEALLSAIRQLRGVADVAPVLAAGEDYFARHQVRMELAEKILALHAEVLRG